MERKESMRYQLIPDVVCTELCGKYLLIASRSASGHLPYIQEINDQAYYCCRIMEEAVSFEKMESMVSSRYGISEKKSERTLRAFLTQMQEAGYLITIADGMEENQSST